jgi:hypothetical protein
MFSSGASDSLTIFTDLKVPANPAIYYSSIQLQFMDYDGSSLPSDALPGGAPSVSRFPWSHAYLRGSSGDGSFDVTVDIDSAQNGGGDELTVSPASGLFVRQQPIVPALVLPPDTLVTGIAGTFNGNQMPGYFWSCYPSWSQTRTVFVCPDASPNLVPGTNHVEWRLQMGDGRIVAKIVDWELIQ